jgi:hypothetical protein
MQGPTQYNDIVLAWKMVMIKYKAKISQDTIDNVN